MSYGIPMGTNRAGMLAPHPKHRFRVLFEDVVTTPDICPVDHGTHRVSSISAEHEADRSGKLTVLLREVSEGQVGMLVSDMATAPAPFELLVEAIDPPGDAWRFRTIYTAVSYGGHTYDLDYSTADTIIYTVTLTFEDHTFAMAPLDAPLIPGDAP